MHPWADISGVQDIDFLDPTNDYVFKRMLCKSQPALLSMVNAIIQGDVPICAAMVQNSEVFAPEPDGHNIRLDILCDLEDGSQINIEMQSWTHPAFENRLLYYFSSLYSNSLKKGESYKRLNPVYVVAWTRNALFHDSPFQNIFELRERRSSRLLTPHCQIQVLQLEKIQHPLSKAQTPLSYWAHFLANRDPARYDEIASLDPGIHNAMTTLKALSQDEKARLFARAREDAARMNYEAHCVSHERGHEEGREKGREEGQRIERAASHAALCRILLKTADQRFDGATPEQKARIEAATLSELQAWLETCATSSINQLDDLLNGTSR